MNICRRTLETSYFGSWIDGLAEVGYLVNALN